MTKLGRILNPSTNSNGWIAVLAAGYALGQLIWNVAHNHQAVDPQVSLATVTAFLSALARQVNTPVADPRVPGMMITPLQPSPDQQHTAS